MNVGAAGTKYYDVYQSGRKERNYSMELTNMGFAVIIVFIIALIIGFFIVVFGFINFLMNYIGNLLIPASSESWFKKNFAGSEAIA